MMRGVLVALCGLYVLLAGGCGLIADKDRIVIARVNDHVIRRGDLYAVLRGMPDEERPNIVNKGDLREVLDDYIDDEIKLALGQKFEADGKIDVPRSKAEEAYFADHPDMRAVKSITDPKAVGMSDAELATVKEEVESGIDRVYDSLLGEAAVQKLSQEYLKEGKITLTDDDLRQEYELQKDQLKNFESIDFIGLRFPASMTNAEAEAANVRRALDQGQRWENILDYYYNLNPDYVFRSRIENNPQAAKFRGFWVTAKGAKKGDVLGPVFIPTYDLMMKTEGSDELQSTTMPDAYLVFQVLEHTPESTMTLEQAKPRIAPGMLYVKTMNELRKENKVEVYDNKLPDPALLSGQDSSVLAQ